MELRNGAKIKAKQINLNQERDTDTGGAMKTKAKRRMSCMLALMLALMMTFSCMTSTGWAAEDSSTYYFGKATEYSTFNSETKDLKDSYYYTDSWFEKDATERNDELALVSMQLTAAAVNCGSDSNVNKFLEGMGFTDVAFVDNFNKYPDSCNYVHAKKALPDGRTVVAVVIQSSSEDSTAKEYGWKQNFIVNGEDQASGEHFALAKAADKVIADIEALGDSNTVFWVTGQSRGGALADLISKRLGDQGKNVYGYTFESPAVVDADAVKGDYGYIHNYLCRDDIVPKIPMWGMTRYGNEYELKTEDTDAGIQEELEKIGSNAAEEEIPDAEGLEDEIVNYLSERVGSRADYSKERTDSFTYEDTGEEVTVVYSYQDALANLMATIFGDGISGASSLLDNIDVLMPAVEQLAAAVSLDGTDDATLYYYNASKELHKVLSDVSDSKLSLTESDMYALLKLIGPYVVNLDYEVVGDAASDIMGYMNPVVSLVASASLLTYSHHFDTLIARLKVLAPAPKVEDIDIKIEDPEAGDDVSKAPQDVEKFFENDKFKDAKDSPWVSAEAQWDTDDSTLQDDYVYYLKVTLETVGHSLPEDISLKLNGKTPVGDPIISYDESTGITRVTFEFQFGEPPEIEVLFDTDGKTETPDPLSVKRGTSLSTKDKPDIPDIVELDGLKYKLEGWYDENGTAWDDIKVTEPMTVHAKWLIYVDLLDIYFEVPSLGDEIEDATVPEDAPYYILEQYCSDPNYDTVDEASSEGEYTLNLSISLKDPDVSTFALEKDEWDFYNYIGDATINGENVDEPDYSEELYYGMSYSYDESGEYVRVEYYFPVTDEEYENEAEGVIDNDGATAYDDAGGEQPPKTGDTSDPVTSAILLVLSIIALSSLFITKKRSA